MQLSIITVNYNDKLGLERTLKSVQEQTFTNYEHIVVDGGSTDGSKELIEANKENFIYWVSEPDNGIYNAMNKGIKVAKGDYLYFLNSGDHFEDSDALQKVNNHLGKNDIVYFNINVVGEREVHIKTCPKELSFMFLHNDLPAHQATFIRKDLFNKYGYYDEKLKIVADWKFLILALCKHNASYKYINDTFSTFYTGGISSKEGSFDAMEKEREQVLNAEFGIFINDLKEIFLLRRKLRNLKSSKKIKLLIKLGLLNDF
jgi:glycosyltransferase involved in cell wall biosynthesis